MKKYNSIRLVLTQAELIRALDTNLSILPEEVRHRKDLYLGHCAFSNFRNDSSVQIKINWSEDS